MDHISTWECAHMWEHGYGSLCSRNGRGRACDQVVRVRGGEAADSDLAMDARWPIICIGFCPHPTSMPWRPGVSNFSGAPVTRCTKRTALDDLTVSRGFAGNSLNGYAVVVCSLHASCFCHDLFTRYSLGAATFIPCHIGVCLP